MSRSERRSTEERRRRRREQRRRARDAARADAAPDPWKQVRRVLIVALGLLALGAGGVAAGYGIAAMRAVSSPVEMVGP